MSDLSRNLEYLHQHPRIFEGRCPASQFSPHDVTGFLRRSTDDMGNRGHFQSHSFFFLLLVLDGTCEYSLDDTVYELPSGATLLTFPYQIHCFPNPPESFRWLTFRFVAERSSWIEPLRHSPRCLSPRMEEHASALIDCFKTREETVDGVLQSNLTMLQLLDTVLSATEVQAKKESGDGDELKNRVKQLVLEQINHSLSLDDVADHIGMSTSYTRSRFRRLYGVSLGNYILQQKIAYSLDLLGDQKLTVQDISERCGFESIFTYSRAFKRIMNLTPQKYRRWWRS